MGLLVSTLFRLYDYFVSFKTIPKMRGKIANDALERLLHQSHSYYQNTFSGSLAKRWDWWDIQAVEKQPL
jgi:ATP-binding cassette, subfamily B, bacterial